MRHITMPMRPRFEQVTVASGQSWTPYDRQVASLPFNWYSPQFELTLMACDTHWHRSRCRVLQQTTLRATLLD